MINCLKESALQKQKLSEKCMKEVVLTMVDAAKLVDADPVLEKLCPTSLVQLNKISILNPMNDRVFDPIIRNEMKRLIDLRSRFHDEGDFEATFVVRPHTMGEPLLW